MNLIHTNKPSSQAHWLDPAAFPTGWNAVYALGKHFTVPNTLQISEEHLSIDSIVKFRRCALHEEQCVQLNWGCGSDPKDSSSKGRHQNVPGYLLHGPQRNMWKLSTTLSSMVRHWWCRHCSRISLGYTYDANCWMRVFNCFVSSLSFFVRTKSTWQMSSSCVSSNNS